VDFLSGLALRRRRGAVMPAEPAVSKKSARKAEPAAKPQFEPAPAPSVPPAASVAESVLLDHPEPTPVQPVSPEVPSPGLQPGGAPSPDTPSR
jgi:hypothetical protein